MRAVVHARSGQRRQEAEARDLSPTGVRLQTLNPLRAGSVMWLKIGNLEPLEITVVWSEGFSAGCRFTQAIHPAVYRALLDTLSAE